MDVVVGTLCNIPKTNTGFETNIMNHNLTFRGFTWASRVWCSEWILCTIFGVARLSDRCIESHLYD